MADGFDTSRNRYYREHWCEHCQTMHRYYAQLKEEDNDRMPDLQAKQSSLSQTLSDVDRETSTA